MGSWGQHHHRNAAEPKARPDHRAIASARSARSATLIREALRVQPAPVLTHEWLAEQTGVSLGYLRWRFPVLDNLHHELGEAR